MRYALATSGLCLLAAAAAPAASAGPPSSYVDDFESYEAGQTIHTQIAPAGTPWAAATFATVAESNTADVDDSGVVDASDLAVLLGSWGGAGAADLDENGTIDAADLAQLLGSWGMSPVADQHLLIDRENRIHTLALPANSDWGFLIAAGAGETLRLSCRVKLDSLDTYCRPAFADPFMGQIVGAAHFGGYHFSGDFAPFTAPDGRFERIAVFAPFDPNFRPPFALTGKTTRTGEWFTIVFEYTQTSYRVLIEDSETIGLFGPGPVEIFPRGPFGAAVNDFGSPVASPYLPPGMEAGFFQVMTGRDPSVEDVPGFEPTAIRIDDVEALALPAP